MVNRLIALSCLASGAAIAVPMGATVHFTPPLASARTIQVTEVVFEPKDGPNPGPLYQAGTMTFRIERPDRF